METIADLLDRDRRSAAPALRAPVADRELSYRDLVTTAWKAGNALRHLGVGPTHRVAVAPDPLPEPVVTFLGAAQLGAATTFAVGTAARDGARAVVVGVEREAAFDLPPGAKLSVYGGEPADATTVHWEEEVWSENPAFPPTDAEGDTTALVAGEASYTHRDCLDAAAGLADRLDLDGDADLRVRALPSAPGAVVAVLAAVSAGATATLTGEDRGNLVVGDETVPVEDARP